MTIIEIVCGVVLIALCLVVTFLTAMTKGEGQGLNAISGKSSSIHASADRNVGLNTVIKYSALVIVLISLVVNVINAHTPPVA